MSLVPQSIIIYVMEPGNDELSIVQITCSLRSRPIPRLRALRKKLFQTSLKRVVLLLLNLQLQLQMGYYRKGRFDDP